MATRKDCQLALDAHESKLCGRANVVGLGIVSNDESVATSPKLAVAVYFEKKLDRKKLAAKDLIPASLEVKRRDRSVQVPVRVIEQGKPQLESFGNEPLLGKEPL